MRPPTRKQSDQPLRVTLTCRPSTNRARQEYAADADINALLRRYGSAVPLRPIQSAEVDYDLDLTRAHHAVREAQEAFRRLPPHLRSKYRTWPALFAAVANGELTTLDPPTPPKEEGAAPAPSDGGGGKPTGAPVPPVSP